MLSLVNYHIHLHDKWRFKNVILYAIHFTYVLAAFVFNDDKGEENL